MKRHAKPHPDSRLHMLCPFCGFACDRTAALSWCGGCFVEFYVNRDGDVVFDTERKTPRFGWGKALVKSGGVSFGRKDKP